MNIALDTNAYCDFQRGNRWLEGIQEAQRVIIPYIVLAELRAGFLQGNRNLQNEARLERFLNTARVALLFPDADTTRHYAALVAQLRKQGTPIPTNDIWIAALCVQHQLILCSADAHFEHLPQLARL